MQPADPIGQLTENSRDLGTTLNVMQFKQFAQRCRDIVS